MDGMKDRGKVVVIAATNRIDSIDPALRRPGRFDREIEIGIPDKDGRMQILEIHTRNVPLGDDLTLQKLHLLPMGFAGADLQSLIKEAAMRSLRRILPEIDLSSQKISPEKLKEIKITKQDMNEAVREAHPSAMREILVQIPETKWDDVGGLDTLKKELLEAIEWPLKHAKEVQHFGVKTILCCYNVSCMQKLSSLQSNLYLEVANKIFLVFVSGNLLQVNSILFLCK